LKQQELLRRVLRRRLAEEKDKMVRKLRVRRKGFKVKATTFRRKGKIIHRRGFRVSPTTFMIRDRGRVGRGPKLIPALKQGSLGVDFSDSALKRRRKEVRLAKSLGEKKVVGKLRAIQVLTKRTSPSTSQKARADARFIAGSFRKKRFVGRGKGFGRNK